MVDQAQASVRKAHRVAYRSAGMDAAVLHLRVAEPQRAPFPTPHQPAALPKAGKEVANTN